MTNVIAAVSCRYCHTGYLPTDAQATVLRGIAPVREWAAQVTEYALDGGWYRRADGELLCRQHAGLGDEPLRRVTRAELAALLPPLPAPLHTPVRAASPKHP